MSKLREILLEYWWREDRDFSKIKIFIIHRGAKGNVKVIEGREVVKISKGSLKLRDVEIPLHRVIKVTYSGKVIYRKRG